MGLARNSIYCFPFTRFVSYLRWTVSSHPHSSRTKSSHALIVNLNVSPEGESPRSKISPYLIPSDKANNRTICRWTSNNNYNKWTPSLQVRCRLSPSLVQLVLVVLRCSTNNYRLCTVLLKNRRRCTHSSWEVSQMPSKQHSPTSWKPNNL